MWPFDDAVAAINALADNGQVILGLDFWEYDEDHRILETPWNAYESEGEATDVRNGRRKALSELARATGVLPEHWVLITW